MSVFEIILESFDLPRDIITFISSMLVLDITDKVKLLQNGEGRISRKSIIFSLNLQNRWNTWEFVPVFADNVSMAVEREYGLSYESWEFCFLNSSNAVIFTLICKGPGSIGKLGQITLEAYGYCDYHPITYNGTITLL